MKRRPSYYNHNGFLMPMGFPVEGFTSALNYQAQTSDIFIVTYPKCGTTWTQYIVWLIQHNGKPLLPCEKLETYSPHLEEVGRETIEKLPPPRLIKTHLLYHLTPYHPQAKYIYVARNPFDCVVSFYHHTRGFTQHYDFAEGTFDDFFDCFIEGKVDFGDYFDNLVSWYQHKQDKHVLFLTYETMKAAPRYAILTIANFLGPDYRNKLEDEHILSKILNNSHFQTMRQSQHRWSSQRLENRPPFIRKGIVGDWKNYFSPHQTQRLLEKFIRCTQGTDLHKLWNLPMY